MEEIEYLEEYEDLILPTINPGQETSEKRITMAAAQYDDDSSSIDQDIFESLFDDHSDDEVLPKKGVNPKFTQSREDRDSLDSIDLLVRDLEERPPLKAGAELGSTAQKAASATTNSIANAKTSTPIATSSGAGKHKSEKNSAPSVQADSTRPIKPKSVATVRPTMQQQLQQKRAIGQKPAESRSTASPQGAVTSTTASSSTSSALKAVNSALNALGSRKQIAAATSTTNELGSSNAKRQPAHPTATIIKPEKVETRDPAEDPLSTSLDNISNDLDSTSLSLSSISGDSLVQLSDLDDFIDGPDAFDLCGDSSDNRLNFEKMRGTTPSPVVSEDYRSAGEPLSSVELLDDFDSNSHAENGNELLREKVEKFFASEEAAKKSSKASKNAEPAGNSADTLLSRIDSVLSSTKYSEKKQATLETKKEGAKKQEQEFKNAKKMVKKNLTKDFDSPALKPDDKANPGRSKGNEAKESEKSKQENDKKAEKPKSNRNEGIKAQDTRTSEQKKSENVNQSANKPQAKKAETNEHAKATSSRKAAGKDHTTDDNRRERSTSKAPSKETSIKPKDKEKEHVKSNEKLNKPTPKNLASSEKQESKEKLNRRPSEKPESKDKLNRSPIKSNEKEIITTTKDKPAPAKESDEKLKKGVLKRQDSDDSSKSIKKVKSMPEVPQNERARNDEKVEKGTNQKQRNDGKIVGNDKDKILPKLVAAENQAKEKEPEQIKGKNARGRPRKITSKEQQTNKNNSNTSKTVTDKLVSNKKEGPLPRSSSRTMGNEKATGDSKIAENKKEEPLPSPNSKTTGNQKATDDSKIVENKKEEPLASKTTGNQKAADDSKIVDNKKEEPLPSSSSKTTDDSKIVENKKEEPLPSKTTGNQKAVAGSKIVGNKKQGPLSKSNSKTTGNEKTVDDSKIADTKEKILPSVSKNQPTTQTEDKECANKPDEIKKDVTKVQEGNVVKPNIETKEIEKDDDKEKLTSEIAGEEGQILEKEKETSVAKTTRGRIKKTNSNEQQANEDSLNSSKTTADKETIEIDAISKDNSNTNKIVDNVKESTPSSSSKNQPKESAKNEEQLEKDEPKGQEDSEGDKEKLTSEMTVEEPEKSTDPDSRAKLKKTASNAKPTNKDNANNSKMAANEKAVVNASAELEKVSKDSKAENTNSKKIEVSTKANAKGMSAVNTNNKKSVVNTKPKAKGSNAAEAKIATEDSTEKSSNTEEKKKNVEVEQEEKDAGKSTTNTPTKDLIKETKRFNLRAKKELPDTMPAAAKATEAAKQDETSSVTNDTELNVESKTSVALTPAKQEAQPTTKQLRSKKESVVISEVNQLNTEDGEKSMREKPVEQIDNKNAEELKSTDANKETPCRKSLRPKKQTEEANKANTEKSNNKSNESTPKSKVVAAISAEETVTSNSEDESVTQRIMRKRPAKTENDDSKTVFKEPKACEATQPEDLVDMANRSLASPQSSCSSPARNDSSPAAKRLKMELGRKSARLRNLEDKERMTDTSGNESDTSTTSRKSQRSIDLKKIDSAKRPNMAEVKKLDISSEDPKTTKRNINASPNTLKREAASKGNTSVTAEPKEEEKPQEPPTKILRLSARASAEKVKAIDSKIAKPAEQTEEKIATNEATIKEPDNVVSAKSVEAENSETSSPTKRNTQQAKGAHEQDSATKQLTARKSLRAKSNVEDEKVAPLIKDNAGLAEKKTITTSKNTNLKEKQVQPASSNKTSTEKETPKASAVKEIAIATPPAKKMKSSPAKSPGSSVLTFAEWLKAQEKEKEAKQQQQQLGENAKKAVPIESVAEISTQPADIAETSSSNTKDMAASDDAEKAAKQLTEKAPKQLTEKAPKQLTEKAPKQLTEKAPKQPTAKAPKQLTEKAPKQLTEKAAKQLTEKAAKQLMEEAAKQLTEKAPKQLTEEAPKQLTEKAPKQLTDSAKNKKKQAKIKKSEIDVLKESMPKTMRDDGFVLLQKESRLRDLRKAATTANAAGVDEPKMAVSTSPVPTKLDTSKTAEVNVVTRAKVVIAKAVQSLEILPSAAEKVDVQINSENAIFKIPLAPAKSTPDNKAKQQIRKALLLKILLNKFKVRKCRVRINRSIVKRYMQDAIPNQSKKSTSYQAVLDKTQLTKSIAGPAQVLTISTEHRRAPSVASPNTTSNVSGVSLHGEDLDNGLLTPMRPATIAATRKLSPQQQKRVAQPNVKGKKQPLAKPVENSNTPTITVPTEVCPPLPVVPTPTTVASAIEPEIAFMSIEPKQEFEYTIVNGAAAATGSNFNSPALGSPLATNAIYQRQLANAATFGLAPPAMDANGTHLYSFLHPATYNHSHSAVSLDHCCPNLDGPMKAIDPTRIHAQVQAAVREVPACIVLTTKFITRADLDTIPEHVRQKIEKQTMAAASAAKAKAVPQIQPGTTLDPDSSIVSTLQKKLPHTTVIGRTTRSRATPTLPAIDNIPPPPPLTHFSALRGNVTATPPQSHRFAIRSQLRRIDNSLKKLTHDFGMLSFLERQRIIEQITSTTLLPPRDFENMALLLQEYIATRNMLLNPSAATSSAAETVPAYPSSDQQVVPAIKAKKSKTTALFSTTSAPKPIYENNRIIGYMNTGGSNASMTKSTTSTRTEIMSTSVSGNVASNYSSICTSSTSATSSVSTRRQPIQNSPRIFYTKPPVQTSTPVQTKSLANVSNVSPGATRVYRRSTPRLSAGITLKQLTSQSGKLPTLTRNPHLTSVTSAAITPTITESSVTITSTTKRITRKTAAAAAGNVIVVMDSDAMPQGLGEECILPDDNSNCAQIKHERDDEDFIGAN